MVEWYSSPSQNFPRKSKLKRGQGDDEDDDDDCNVDVSRFFPNSSNAKVDDDIPRDSDGKELPMFADEPCLESDEADPHKFTRITQRWQKGKKSKLEEEPPPKEPPKPDVEEVIMQSIREAERLNKLMLERTIHSAMQRTTNNPRTEVAKNPPVVEKMTPITPRSYFAQKSVLPSQPSKLLKADRIIEIQRSALPSQSSQLSQADAVNVTKSGPMKRRLPGLTTSTPTSTNSKRFCYETKSLAEIDLSPISCVESQERKPSTPVATPMIESPKSRHSFSKLRSNMRPALRSSLVSLQATTSAASSSKQVQPGKEQHKESITKTLPSTKPETKPQPPKEDDDFQWDD